MAKKSWENIEQIEKWKKINVFSRIWWKIEEIKSALRYNFPDAERIVKLKWWKEKEAMEKEKTYIDENNFRLQIWKMQENWETIYRPMMLKFGLEYITKHIKLDENGNWKVIIQLWPDLAQCLAQDDKQILSFEEEKKKIEELIKKILWKKWECIEIQNVADNYPDVFDALRKWKKGIIPEQEPNLDNFEVPLKSPLQIIKYLAYHCQTDQELMKLFYNTKPDKYIWQDQRKQLKPWESDADYYSVVEVWIRLFEVINWITIQWWIGRQRVYDKIISLILFGKDRIWKYKDFKTLQPLTSWKYKSLKALHDWISKNYEDINMQQLYIELDEKSLAKLESHENKKEKYKSKIKKAWLIAALIASLWTTGWVAISEGIESRKREEKEREEQRLQDERIEYWRQFNESKDEDRRIRTLPEWEMYSSFLSEQTSILLAEYDLSSYDYPSEYWVVYNKIEEEYKDVMGARYNWTGEFLTAEEFMKYFGWTLIDRYHLPPQKPYEYLKNEQKEAIVNTLRFWGCNDISKYKIEEISTTKTYHYFIKWKWVENSKIYGNYQLKIFRVYFDDGHYIDLMFAAKTNAAWEPIGDFTIENGVLCMTNLWEYYWEWIEWIN